MGGELVPRMGRRRHLRQRADGEEPAVLDQDAGGPRRRSHQRQAVLGQRRHRPELPARGRRPPARARRWSPGPPSRDAVPSWSTRPHQPVHVGSRDESVEDLASITRAARGTADRWRRSGTAAATPGRRPDRSARPRRRRAGRRSTAGTSLADRGPWRRSAPAGTGSPPNSQITVRSLNSAEKQSPWSMPQTAAVEARGGSGRSCGRCCWRRCRRRTSSGAARGGPRVLVQREVVLLEVGVDEQLERAFADGPSRTIVGGTTPQPSASRQLLRRRLAPVEARREVPQRTLAPAAACRSPWRVVVAALDGDEERGVRAPGHAPLDLDLTVTRRSRASTDQFIRAQRWPSGSIGRPHNRHDGRPAPTTPSAWVQNATAWPRVRWTRARALDRLGRRDRGCPPRRWAPALRARSRRGRCRRRRPRAIGPTDELGQHRLGQFERAPASGARRGRGGRRASRVKYSAELADLLLLALAR